MSEQREIWESAQNMIERYGDEALKEVKLRIRELAAHGQTDARCYWERIEKALHVLLGDESRDLRH